MAWPPQSHAQRRACLLRRRCTCMASWVCFQHGLAWSWSLRDRGHPGNNGWIPAECQLRWGPQKPKLDYLSSLTFRHMFFKQNKWIASMRHFQTRGGNPGFHKCHNFISIWSHWVQPHSFYWTDSPPPIKLNLYNHLIILAERREIIPSEFFAQNLLTSHIFKSDHPQTVSCLAWPAPKQLSHPARARFFNPRSL